MGTPDFAVPILKSVFDSKHKILEVYTQPPKKKNRGQKIQLSAIHDFSNKLGIPVRHPSFFEKNELDHIKKLNLPTSINNFFTIKYLMKILFFMLKDKKNKSDKISLVLLNKIGSAVINKEYSKERLKLFLKDYLRN